ncbi:MAG: oligopeptide transporter, OPT family [Leptospiraceae bacterium]|nr:oligopeptide transporter, OPT family [Leptospiraceae bacterium]
MPRLEFTLRAVLIGSILAVVLGAANTWLGLYAGMTVSASIPAAVISMAILRGLLRSGTIQENNIVQSIASAGESLAAGVIFTVPAMVLIGAWQDFEFWPTTFIALGGGILGIVFMIPLRPVLMERMPHLQYPEGQACARVLQAGEGQAAGARRILGAALIGSGYKFFASFSGLMSAGLQLAIRPFDKVLLAFSSDTSPALIGVGYIVRLPIASLLFLGGVIGSGFLLPLSGFLDMPAGDDPYQLAAELWSDRVRYMGVGAMILGGVYSLIEVLVRIIGQRQSWLGQKADSDRRPVGAENPDLSIWSLLGLFVAATACTMILYESLIQDISQSILVILILLPACFLFVAVAAYIVGLVGSSNSPVSGMTISVLLLVAAILLGLGIKSDSTAMVILGVAGIVCCATATAGDIAQDLKTGQLVGATPRWQQWGEVIGVLVTAPLFAFILSALHAGPGIGTGAPGSLAAPQASLFAALTQGVLDGGLPWNYLLIGAASGLVLLALDFILKHSGSSVRLYLMPFAVGLYLPMAVTTPIFVGGLIRYLGDRKARSADGGILFGSGLIAGEALTGIVIALFASQGPLLLFSSTPAWLQGTISALVFGLLAILYYRSTRVENK